MAYLNTKCSFTDYDLFY